MTAETLTGSRGSRYFPAQSNGYTSTPVYCWGSYDIAANVEDGDIFEMCRTPNGFLLMGGWLTAEDIDTGTETLDMDLGWAANGNAAAESVVAPWGSTYTDVGYQASATGLGNLGVWTGDGTTGLLPAPTAFMILPAKPLWFSRSTVIQIEANAAANAFTAGKVTVCLQGIILPK